MQTLGLINIGNMRTTNEGIEIKIPDRIKTSRINKPRLTSFLSFFSKNLNLCVASALEAYLKKTKGLRSVETKLFISFKKPFKAVSS